MTSPYPEKRLSSILRQVEDAVPVEPTAVYRGAGILSYGRGLFNKGTFSGSETRYSKLRRLHAGQIVYSRLFAWEGAFAFVEPEFDGACVSQEFPAFDVDETADPKWVHLCLSRTAFWESLVGTGLGQRRRRVQPKEILAKSVPMPELAEQRRLLGRISGLAERVDQARKLMSSAATESRAVVRSVMHQLTGACGPISRHLSDVLEYGPRNGLSFRCDNSEGGTPVLTLGAVTGFEYKSSAIKRTSEPVSPNADYWLKPGDLLITRSNTPGLVGHAAIYDGNPEKCIFPDLIMRCRVKAAEADVRFVHYWLQSPLVRNFLQRRAKGTSPTMKKIAQGDVQEIPFPVLDATSQRALVAHLDRVRAKIRELHALQVGRLDNSEALRASIIHAAFRGQL